MAMDFAFRDDLLSFLYNGGSVVRVVELERSSTHLRSHLRIALGNQLPPDEKEKQIYIDAEQIPHTLRIRYPLPITSHRVAAIRVYLEKSGFVPVLSYFEVTKGNEMQDAYLDGDNNPWICSVSEVK